MRNISLLDVPCCSGFDKHQGEDSIITGPYKETFPIRSAPARDQLVYLKTHPFPDKSGWSFCKFVPGAAENLFRIIRYHGQEFFFDPGKARDKSLNRKLGIITGIDDFPSALELCIAADERILQDNTVCASLVFEN